MIRIKVNHLFFIVVVVAIAFRCVNSESPSEKSSRQEKDQTEKIEQPEKSGSTEINSSGKVVDEMVENPINEAVESIEAVREIYSTYIPLTLNIEEELPVVFIFDPHARGYLPVEKYIPLAEEFGFVLVGSNKSQNNQIIDEGLGIYNEMKTGIESRIIINPKQIYTLGFSGGARVAVSIAIQESEVNTVIGCGAGFPVLRRMPDPNFYYFGFVGYEDFNMGELINNDRYLTRSGFLNELVIFDGGHEWPTVEIMREAFLAIQINNIREEIIINNPELINETLDYYRKKIKKYAAADRYFDASETAQRARSVLKEVALIKEFADKTREYRKNALYANDLSKMVKTLEKEAAIQSSYIDNFNTKDVAWWRSEIIKIKTPVDDVYEQRLNKRLESYLGLITFMVSNKAIDEDDLVQAQKNIEIYRIIEPANSEHAYLSAVIMMKKNNEHEAINFLNQAIVLGFNNTDRFTNEPLFNSIETRQAMMEMMKR